MVNIDQKDRQLLYELEIDCRQSFRELGKKINLSKQAVHARTERMIQTGLIHSFSIVLDRSKLGQTQYEMWIQLNNVDTKKKEEFERYLIEHSETCWVARCGGAFDYAFDMAGADISVFDEFLKKMFTQYPGLIKNHYMTTITHARVYPRTYLIGGDTLLRKEQKYWQIPKKVEIDETDKKILKELNTNSRISSMALAKITELTPTTVMTRIKRLEKEGVIQAYRAILQPSVAGIHYYEILISTQEMTEEWAKKLETYCRLNPNIFVLLNIIGRWNIDIGIDAENQAQFQKILEEIKREFGPIIREYQDVPIQVVKKFI